MLGQRVGWSVGVVGRLETHADLRERRALVDFNLVFAHAGHGPNRGVQIDFTALGARLFFNRPLGELANRTVPLVDLLDVSSEDFATRLFDVSTWEQRFDVLDT